MARGKNERERLTRKKTNRKILNLKTCLAHNQERYHVTIIERFDTDITKSEQGLFFEIAKR